MDNDFENATNIINNNVAKVKHTSQNLAHKLNALLNGNIDNSLTEYYLETIEKDFKTAYSFFKSTYSKSITIARKYDLPGETKENVFFLGYSLYRIERLYTDCSMLVYYYCNEPDYRESILNELCGILRQLRTLYL